MHTPIQSLTPSTQNPTLTATVGDFTYLPILITCGTNYFQDLYRIKIPPLHDGVSLEFWGMVKDQWELIFTHAGWISRGVYYLPLFDEYENHLSGYDEIDVRLVGIDYFIIFDVSINCI
jgi:hypothetical protein